MRSAGFLTIEEKTQKMLKNCQKLDLDLDLGLDLDLDLDLDRDWIG